MNIFRVLSTLSKTLWESNIPFMSVQTTGFLGWIRLQLNEHVIIESHPDNEKNDLRLDVPFPELQKHMDEITLKEREDVVKTPWLIVLYKALQAYEQRNQNGNSTDNGSQDSFPALSKQKREFKGYLRECMM